MNEIEDLIDGLEFKPDPQQEKDYEAIKQLLITGKETKLTLELIYQAFSEIKGREEMTIEEACRCALWEWDC